MGIEQPKQSELAEEAESSKITIAERLNTPEEIQCSIYDEEHIKAETQYLKEKSREVHKMPENFDWSESAYQDLIAFVHFYNFNKAIFQELIRKNLLDDLYGYTYKRFYSDSCEDYIDEYDKIKEISNQFKQDINDLGLFIQKNFKETGFGISATGFGNDSNNLLINSNEFYGGGCRFYLNFNSPKMMESLCEILSGLSEKKVQFLIKLFKQTSGANINRRDKCVVHIGNIDLQKVVNVFRKFVKLHPEALNISHPGFIEPIVDEQGNNILGISVADPQGNASPGVNISNILVSVVKRLSDEYPSGVLDVNSNEMLEYIKNMLIDESQKMHREQPERFSEFHNFHPAFVPGSKNYQMLFENGLIK
jgi:hypothetical protein